ncbi:MAG: hypothetical protein GX275_12455 [Clostridiales bacterium]|nr:hypothetical protein [Clostridiales bacterium]
MKKEARDLFLAGIGTAALTCEKAGDVITKLIEKGKISVEEGKELSIELKRNIEEKGKEKLEDIKPITKDSLKETLKEVLSEIEIERQKDIVEIKNRLDKIEDKLKESEN